MTNPKPKMSTSYRAIFFLSIFMVFFVLIAGAATNSKSSGFGMWIWGYTAWLMYKRRNADLVSFYKGLLWFDVIAAGVAVAVLSFSDNDVSRYVGYSLGEALILFAVVFSLTFGLFKYFSNLSISIDSLLNSNLNDDSTLWEQVSDEIKNGKRIDSLWARAYSEADGDSNKANARYMKLRYDQIKFNSYSNNNNSNNPTSSKNKSKFSYYFLNFWNRFNTIGKVSIIGIVLLICYGFYLDNFDPFYEKNVSSKGNSLYKSPPTSSSIALENKSSTVEEDRVPIFDPWKPYTQESTNSKEIGPWLNYLPQGTRFCKSNDGTIHKLYPPGVAPYANKVDPYCWTNSKLDPRNLNPIPK